MTIDKEAFTAAAAQCLKRWGCVPEGEAFFTHSSLLWPVARGDEKLMMKIVDPHDDEGAGAAVLRFYDGAGAVRVAESADHVQLLERVIGHDGHPTLEQMVLNGDDDKATAIICDAIARLHAVAAPLPATLIPFRQRSEAMRGHVEEGRVRQEDRPLFQTAYDLCDELIAETASTERLLHGDVHHFNILHSSARGWLAIDPKGIRGPRVYEYANTLCNPYRHDLVTQPARMERQAHIMAERAELDRKLLLEFVFLHALQCAAWSLHEPSQAYWMACGRAAAQLAGMRI